MTLLWKQKLDHRLLRQHLLDLPHLGLIMVPLRLRLQLIPDLKVLFLLIDIG